ncbi:unnamed protein product, partial [Polarella glacialis]
LAPYNVLHSHMATVLQGAHMPLDPNFVDVWAHPLCCTAAMPDETLSGRSISQPETKTNSTYHFVHPSKFIPVVVPENGPRGDPLQLVLPEVYHDAMKQQNEEIIQIQMQMMSITDDAAKKKANEAIQGHFREWLHSTGKSRQLADLARFAGQFQERL